jgi:hypothetical protein
MSIKLEKLLVGVKAICAYLDDISEPTFYKFVKLGMPAIVIDGRWYAYTENLDNFFQKLTFAQMRDIPEGAE